MSVITFVVRLDALGKVPPLLNFWWKLYLSMQKNQTMTDADFEAWFVSFVEHLISKRTESRQIREETRRYFWELMTQQHTPLINQLYLKVAQHPDFADWQANHAINANELMSLWRSFEDHPQFSTMPDGAYVSARLVVGDTYESWLALQKERQEKLEKVSRSLGMLQSDAELISISGCSIDELRGTARAILSGVNA